MKNFAELDAKICSCTDALTAKLDGVGGKRAILLCGGTGCLSSNSMDIKGKFDELVAANHMDWPCFYIKPDPEQVAAGCLKLSVEPYGGLIHSTWMDRPLSCAGLVTLLSLLTAACGSLHLAVNTRGGTFTR